jgi:hypothetical protein
LFLKLFGVNENWRTLGLGRPRKLHILINAQVRAVAPENIVEARSLSKRLPLSFSFLWMKHVSIVVVLVDFEARWCVLEPLLVLDLALGCDDEESLLGKCDNFILLIPVYIVVEVLHGLSHITKPVWLNFRLLIFLCSFLLVNLIVRLSLQRGVAVTLQLQISVGNDKTI